MPRNRAKQRYKAAHWGAPSRTQIEVKDPLLPATLTEMGKLTELKVQNGRRRDVIQFPESDLISLSFDPRSASARFTQSGPDRLYLTYPSDIADQIRANYWNPRNAQDLGIVAQQAKCRGRQSDYPYPPVSVTPIGLLHEVCYLTHKIGDENPDDPRSEYQHHMGEGNGIKPILCCDQDGYLWLAGGDYTVPDAGITN